MQTTVQELYQRLTQAWEKPVTDPETGAMVSMPMPALIPELRDAVFGGMENTGGSGFGAPLPISDGALDLYERIDQEVTEAWVALFPGQLPSAE